MPGPLLTISAATSAAAVTPALGAVSAAATVSGPIAEGFATGDPTETSYHPALGSPWTQRTVVAAKSDWDRRQLSPRASMTERLIFLATLMLEGRHSLRALAALQELIMSPGFESWVDLSESSVVRRADIRRQEVFDRVITQLKQNLMDLSEGPRLVPAVQAIILYCKLCTRLNFLISFRMEKRMEALLRALAHTSDAVPLQQLALFFLTDPDVRKEHYTKALQSRAESALWQSLYRQMKSAPQLPLSPVALDGLMLLLDRKALPDRNLQMVAEASRQAMRAGSPEAQVTALKAYQVLARKKDIISDPGLEADFNIILPFLSAPHVPLRAAAFAFLDEVLPRIMDALTLRRMVVASLEHYFGGTPTEYSRLGLMRQALAEAVDPVSDDGVESLTDGDPDDLWSLGAVVRRHPSTPLPQPVTERPLLYVGPPRWRRRPGSMGIPQAASPLEDGEGRVRWVGVPRDPMGFTRSRAAFANVDTSPFLARMRDGRTSISDYVGEVISVPEFNRLALGERTRTLLGWIHRLEDMLGYYRSRDGRMEGFQVQLTGKGDLQYPVFIPIQALREVVQLKRWARLAGESGDLILTPKVIAEPFSAVTGVEITADGPVDVKDYQGHIPWVSAWATQSPGTWDPIRVGPYRHLPPGSWDLQHVLHPRDLYWAGTRLLLMMDDTQDIRLPYGPRHDHVHLGIPLLGQILQRPGMNPLIATAIVQAFVLDGDLAGRVLAIAAVGVTRDRDLDPAEDPIFLQGFGQIVSGVRQLLPILRDTRLWLWRNQNLDY